MAEQGPSLRPCIVVIGGANADISGTPHSSYLRAESNPGIVTLTPGGVGRNIAENLARLRLEVHLITALGEDANGHFLMQQCSQAGIDMADTERFPDAATPVYLCLNDERGEMVGAVSDMGLLEAVSPEMLMRHLPLLQRADLIVLDANLRRDSIEWVCGKVTCPIFADPVSVKKAAAFMNVLPAIALIKPNRAEAALLAGLTEPISRDALPSAAKALQQKGLKQALISLGADGVYYDDGLSAGIIPPAPDAPVNTTGCGDAFLAGCVYAYLSGCDLKDMAAWGTAASALCARHVGAVNPAMSPEALNGMLHSLRS